jgi:hypothetical protein
MVSPRFITGEKSEKVSKTVLVVVLGNEYLVSGSELLNLENTGEKLSKFN